MLEGTRTMGPAGTMGNNGKQKWLAQGHTAGHGQSKDQAQVPYPQPSTPSSSLAVAFRPRFPFEWSLESMESTLCLSSFLQVISCLWESPPYLWLLLVILHNEPIKFSLEEIPTEDLVLQVRRFNSRPYMQVILSKGLRNHWLYLSINHL